MNISLPTPSASPIEWSQTPNWHLWRTPGRGLVVALALVLLVGNVFGQNEKWTRYLGAEPNNRSRTFDLHIVNNTTETVTFTVTSTACCDSPLTGAESAPVPPGGQTKMWIARVQGNGCDGENGWFTIRPDEFGGEAQNFGFDNAGWISAWDWPTRYHSRMSEKNKVDGSYTWTMLPAEARLKAPVDERLTKPRNYIAYDSGEWARLDSQTTAKIEHLEFSQNNYWPVWYETCFGAPLFHPQHMKRLPNKDGRAYFMIAGSRGYNGYLSLLETYDGALDPETDLIRTSLPGDPNSNMGKIIWQDVFTGEFNGTLNPIGNWNHPCKMAVMGGVLIVVAQNWSEGQGIDGCTHATTNTYLTGTSEDSIIFYDIRDPAKPVYWGKMSAADLNLPDDVTKYNGARVPFKGRVISEVSLIYLHDTGKWELTVGAGSEDKNYTRWETGTVSPYIEDWTQVAGAGTANSSISNRSREHGDDFESYQWAKDRNDTKFPMGQVRTMWFDATNNGVGGGDYDGFTFKSYNGGSSDTPNMGSLGRDRDWASDSI